MNTGGQLDYITLKLRFQYTLMIGNEFWKIIFEGSSYGKHKENIRIFERERYKWYKIFIIVAYDSLQSVMMKLNLTSLLHGL